MGEQTPLGGSARTTRQRGRVTLTCCQGARGPSWPWRRGRRCGQVGGPGSRRSAGGPRPASSSAGRWQVLTPRPSPEPTGGGCSPSPGPTQPRWCRDCGRRHVTCTRLVTGRSVFPENPSGEALTPGPQNVASESGSPPGEWVGTRVCWSGVGPDPERRVSVPRGVWGGRGAAARAEGRQKPGQAWRRPCPGSRGPVRTVATDLWAPGCGLPGCFSFGRGRCWGVGGAAAVLPPDGCRLCPLPSPELPSRRASGSRGVTSASQSRCSVWRGWCCAWSQTVVSLYWCPGAELRGGVGDGPLTCAVAVRPGGLAHAPQRSGPAEPHAPGPRRPWVRTQPP